MTTKLIRMSSGEDLIATVVAENGDETITLQDAIVAVPTSTGSIGFVPWAPLLSKTEKEIVVSKQFVVYIADADADVVLQYSKMFSKLITPQNTIIK